MAYSLKKRLEIEAERRKLREERQLLKEEKERIKKEEQKEKKLHKKKEKRKEVQRKLNKRFYMKVKKEREEMHRSIGDEYAFFNVIITKDRKKIKRIGAAWWKVKAYKIYNEAIEKNRQNIVFPKTNYISREGGGYSKKDYLYEILLVKKTKEDETTVNAFRNKEGKLIDTIISDLDNHIILEKTEWFVEETFTVQGYHPLKDKKPYSFLLNKFFVEAEDDIDNMKKVLVYKNKVIIQYFDDFDFITCRDNDQAITLYEKFQRDVEKLNKKYVFFMGMSTSPKWLDKMEEKTGRNRLTFGHKAISN